MTHSKVYYDGESYVVQVAHVQFKNEIEVPTMDGGYLSGLLEYIIRPGDGVLKVHDPDDNVMYEVHTVEDWGGLDKGAVQALLDAVDGSSEVLGTGNEFLRAWTAYLRTGDQVAALAKHKIGTVVRIDYGYNDPGAADIALKVGDTSWSIAGSEDIWEDDKIEEYTYEVIYSV